MRPCGIVNYALRISDAAGRDEAVTDRNSYFVVNILSHAEFWRYLFMKWEEARTYYPAQWLLVEAIKAHSEANKRILDEIAVVNVFNNSQEAMQSYGQFHHQCPEHELYVVHTDRKALDITERRWIGIRGIR